MEFWGGALVALALRGALAALIVLPPRGACAQLSEADEATLDTEARLLFEAGRSAFVDGRYEAALERFQQAYETSRRPDLLYNIGTTADRLRRDEEALEAFTGYLAALPEAENRREVEARIASLREAIERLAAARGGTGGAAGAETPGATGPGGDTATGDAGAAGDAGDGGETEAPDANADAEGAADAGPRTVHPEWAGWTALGGLVVAAAGAIPAALAGGTRSELEQLCGPDLRCPAGYEAVRDRGVSEALAADVLFGLGGAMAVGFGLVWLLVEEPAPPVTASAACSGEGCAVLVGGRW